MGYLLLDLFSTGPEKCNRQKNGFLAVIRKIVRISFLRKYFLQIISNYFE